MKDTKIPTEMENPNGLHQRYIVRKANGEEVDQRAEYFVLRVDKYGDDKQHINACRIAVLAYATEIEHYLPELAADLRARYNQAVEDGKPLRFVSNAEVTHGGEKK